MKRFKLMIAITLCSCSAASALPLGTGFTYQGQLKQNGQPISGTANLLFRLFDNSSGGALLGSQVINGVSVTGGLFTVELNAAVEFGASAFNGEQRWLEITVNGTPLSPRQELAAAPYALFAQNADRLEGLNSSAFLQSVPNPLTLTGTSTTQIIRAENASTSFDAAAVYGLATAAIGTTYGGRFDNSSTSGYGVIGLATAAIGPTHGVFGRSVSPDGRGVSGEATDSSGGGFAIGVYGQSYSTFGHGVYGLATSTGGRGVTGEADASTGTTSGGNFISRSTSGTGVRSKASASSGTTYGVYGESNSQQGNGVHGLTTAAIGGGWGVWGESYSDSGRGVAGHVYHASGPTTGVHGQSNSTSGRGVLGRATAASGTTYGVLGENPHNGSGWGVYAQGHLGASGVKAFRIDHPDDPENKYLLHYSIESPEVLNAYRGFVTLDSAGEAVVELPRYFAKLNKDPSYQLTAVGASMPMLHVALKISEPALSAGAAAGPGKAAPLCTFRIAGGVPGGEVSWRVEAVRNDHSVQNRGAPVEVEKQDSEKGTYQHPEFYGQPPEKGLNYDASAKRSITQGKQQ